MTKAKEASEETLVSELSSIKRLLIYALLRSGVSQSQVAAALGTSQSKISRMFPEGIGSPARRR